MVSVKTKVKHLFHLINGYFSNNKHQYRGQNKNMNLLYLSHYQSQDYSVSTKPPRNSSAKCRCDYKLILDTFSISFFKTIKKSLRKNLILRNVNLSRNEIVYAFMLLLFIICIIPSYNAYAQPVGINLSPIRDWSSELVFNDIFKRARKAWVSVQASNMAPNSHSLQTDKNGWIKRLFPRQWAVSYIFTGFRGHLPKARYKCLYKGNGKIGFENATILDQGKGRLELKLNPDSNYVTLIIEKTDPNNYIRNIRILPLDDKGKIITATFRTDFLNRWKGFKVLRFMDWMNTNNNTVSRWSNRATKSYFSQATNKGVALEYMIELANTLKIPPWFCMPYKASDEYVRKFATMVKAKLDPSLKCYVEYSNEVWNRIFPASRYVQRMGLKLGLPNDDGMAGMRFYSQRSLEIFRIWKNVFGSTKRFYRVLSSQAAWPARAVKILDWRKAYKHADALAIAPYFSISSKAFKDGNLPTLNGIFAMLDKKVDDDRALFITFHKMAKSRNLQLIAYEAGQSLYSLDNPALANLYTQANRDPRMYFLYKKYLNYWFQSGGGLINHYDSVESFSRTGNWGALEWYDQPISPTSKYAALVDSLSSH